MTPKTLSLRGENASKGRANPSWLKVDGRVCLFACRFTVDRHGLRPRDDKVENDICGSRTTHTLSLRGENVVTDAAIHRVSGNADNLSLRFLDYSGSPRATTSR